MVSFLFNVHDIGAVTRNKLGEQFRDKQVITFVESAYSKF